MPPIIPGVTNVPSDSPVNPLTKLLELLGGGPQAAPSTDRLRDVIGQLQEIAERDSRLAPRCTRAIEVLRGQDTESDNLRESPEVHSKVGSLVGGIKTPI